MSHARGFPNAGHYYNNIVSPVRIDMQFTVNSSDSGGLGITSLKSNGYVQRVFMNTSATPATGSPNPAAGYAQVILKQNFNKFLGLTWSYLSPNSGTPINVTSGVTAGLAYVITSLGNTSTAQWQHLGLPPGFTPAVGQSFIATSSTTATGTGQVQVPATAGAGVEVLDVVGSPNTEINNSSIAANAGAQLTLRFLHSGTKTAPATGTVVNVSLFFDNSSVTVDGL